jgi:hypothetical protein
MSMGLRTGHAYYHAPSKPLPKWQFYLLFWAIVPIGIVLVIGWEIIKATLTSVKKRTEP